jgi:hypothetical protein
VGLSSDNPLIALPSQLVIAKGSTTGHFTAATGSFSVNQTATVSTTLNGVYRNITFSLVAGALNPMSVDCGPSILGPNGTTLCNVRVASSGQDVTLLVYSDDPEMSVPASIPLSAGSDSTGFLVKTGNISRGWNAIVTVMNNGITGTANLFVTPETIVRDVTCPSILGAGTKAICTISMSRPVGVDGATIALSSNDPFLSLAEWISVAAGQLEASFQITVGAVGEVHDAVITIAGSGSSTATRLTLIPGLLRSSPTQ